MLAVVVAVLALSAAVLWLPPFSRWTFTPNDIHLCVLPFVNVAGEETYQALCDGLVESITSRLTQLESDQEQLWVVPAADVRQRGVSSAGQAEQTFGVNRVVSGSLRFEAQSIRATLNLIDPVLLRQLDSATVTRLPDEIAALEAKILESLSEMLGMKRPAVELRQDSTPVPQAYSSYLQARGFLQRYESEQSLDQAIGLLNATTELDPTYAEAYASLAEAYWRKFQLSKDSAFVEMAQTFSDRALGIDDKSLQVLLTQGLIYRETGQHEDAIEAFEKATNLDPDSSDALRELALAYEHVKDLDKAEQSYRKAIDLKPSYWSGYSHLGVFFLRQGQTEKATEMFLKVTELTPNNPRGYSLLGTSYYYAAKHSLAAEMFEKSLNIQPTATGFNNLGTLYFMMGEYLEARRCFEEAVALGVNRHTVWGNLGDAYRYTQAEPELAEDAYEKAVARAESLLEVNPNDAEVRSALATYLSQLGEHGRAQETIEQAVHLNPTDVMILYRKIIVYELAGDREAALDAVRSGIAAGVAVEEIKKDPDLSQLRDDARFRAMGLDSPRKNR
jgi:tetratricopeptide (TPR) repeat protein